MDDEFELLALSTGEIYGGDTHLNDRWGAPLHWVGVRVDQLREGVESPVNVNVVFQIPGPFLSPDFVGTRTGSFRKRDRLLMVQVALPEGPPEDPEQYLRVRMGEAIDEAEVWARKRRLAPDLATLRQIVDEI